MKNAKKDSIREAWVLSLILGFIMINFPFIHIFNTVQPLFGIPKLVLYFFVGWPASIAIIWLFVHFSNSNSQDNDNIVESKSNP